MRFDRIAIIGSRTFNDYDLLRGTIISKFNPSIIDEIVSGGAMGADKLGERFAQEFGIKTNIYLPDWEKYGKRAGFIRNTDIIKNSDFVFAFWDEKSAGTLDSIRTAKKLNIPVIVIPYDRPVTDW